MKTETLRKMHKEYQKRISEKVCTVNEEDFEEKLLMNIEKRPDEEKVRELLETPIGLLPKKYRDAYYLLFKKEEREIPEDRKIKFQDSDIVYDRLYLSIRLINVIRKHLLKKDKTITDQDVEVIPYFSLLDDTEIISGCITFFKFEDKSINEVGLFSFDIDNKTYGRQIWKDFDSCLKDYLDRGWKVSWFTYKQNKACKHYDGLISKLNGKKEDFGSGWKYIFGE